MENKYNLGNMFNENEVISDWLRNHDTRIVFFYNENDGSREGDIFDLPS